MSASFIKFDSVDTLVRPDVSFPGSSYHNINKFLTPHFEKLHGARIEIATLDARKKHELILLGENKRIVLLDVKCYKVRCLFR